MLEYYYNLEQASDSEAIRTCLASSSRSTFPEAKKGESGGNLRRRGFQYGKPNSAIPIAIALR